MRRGSFESFLREDGELSLWTAAGFEIFLEIRVVLATGFRAGGGLMLLNDNFNAAGGVGGMAGKDGMR